MSNLDEPLVFTPVCSDIACVGCLWSNGEPPWEDDPKKAYCRVYRRADGLQKPNDILFKGASCEFKDTE